MQRFISSRVVHPEIFRVNLSMKEGKRQFKLASLASKARIDGKLENGEEDKTKLTIEYLSTLLKEYEMNEYGFD